KIYFTHTKAFSALKANFAHVADIHMRELFQNTDRFDRFSLVHEDILFDFSKNRITEETLQLLVRMAEECDVETSREAMFSGEPINETERRSVLHTALRDFTERPIYVDGIDIKPEIARVLKKMETFSNQVISGSWKGFSGKPITDVVNIGI